MPVEIIHACLPEETLSQSAVLEFANRARLQMETIHPQVSLHPLREETTSGENDDTFRLFLISCGADGSVHRVVRKFVKKIKEEPPTKSQYCVALLGHAVCKTSAEQMKEQIFAAGRRC